MFHAAYINFVLDHKKSDAKLLLNQRKISQSKRFFLQNCNKGKSNTLHAHALLQDTQEHTDYFLHVYFSTHTHIDMYPRARFCQLFRLMLFNFINLYCSLQNAFLIVHLFGLVEKRLICLLSETMHQIV